MEPVLLNEMATTHFGTVTRCLRSLPLRLKCVAAWSPAGRQPVPPGAACCTGGAWLAAGRLAPPERAVKGLPAGRWSLASAPAGCGMAWAPAAGLIACCPRQAASAAASLLWALRTGPARADPMAVHAGGTAGRDPAAPPGSWLPGGARGKLYAAAGSCERGGAGCNSSGISVSVLE